MRTTSSLICSAHQVEHRRPRHQNRVEDEVAQPEFDSVGQLIHAAHVHPPRLRCANANAHQHSASRTTSHPSRAVSGLLSASLPLLAQEDP
eukprot:1181070-Prorocentrum_minimum.AAC.5